VGAGSSFSSSESTTRGRLPRAVSDGRVGGGGVAMSAFPRISSLIKFISDGLGDPSIERGSGIRSCSPALRKRGGEDILKNIFWGKAHLFLIFIIAVFLEKNGCVG